MYKGVLFCKSLFGQSSCFSSQNAVAFVGFPVIITEKLGN